MGHAKSICLNFGIAQEFGGRCNLRFDDTNPEKEEQEYVNSIIDSVRWLGFDFGPEPFFASDYFDFMYKAAEYLISAGHAYVDSPSADSMRESRGTLTSPGKNSPFRERSADENLRLFREMREGRHPDGAMVLRAKIDMASPNINMRDPAIYRIKHAEHHRTGKPIVSGIPRIAVVDVDIDGFKAPAGTPIALSLLSALRDPEVYEAPDQFNIYRTDHPRWHPIFGAGAHRCVGEALAKAEMEEVLATIARLAPNTTLVGDFPRLAPGAIRQVDRMQVAFA